MKKIKMNSDTAMGIALGVLGLVQVVLSNKKEAKALEKLKEEVTSEVIEKLNS